MKNFEYDDMIDNDLNEENQNELKIINEYEKEYGKVDLDDKDYIDNENDIEELYEEE